MKAQLLAAAARYRVEGRWAYGFARGKLLYDPVYRSVVPLIEGHVWVDIGCAEGYLIAAALECQPALSCVAMDHDAARLQLARAVHGADSRVQLEQADVRQWALPAAQTITCLDVLHYLSFAEQDALLSRLYAALVSGGLLIVRDAEAASGLLSWITRASEWAAIAVGRHKGDGVNLRPRAALLRAMTQVGFEVVARPCREGTPFANTLFVARKSR